MTNVASDITSNVILHHTIYGPVDFGVVYREHGGRKVW